MSIYKHHGLLSFGLDTENVGLASATVAKILVKKPNGTTAVWAGTVSGTKIIYNFTGNEFDQAGNWSFQAYYEIAGVPAYGNIVKQEIEIPIKYPVT